MTRGPSDESATAMLLLLCYLRSLSVTRFIIGQQVVTDAVLVWFWSLQRVVHGWFKAW